MKLRRAGIFFLLLALSAHTVQARPLLTYEIAGIQGEQLANVEAYLGPFPETEHDRDNLLYSARRDVTLALNALGHYQPDIQLQLRKNSTPWALQVTVQPGPRVTIADLRIELTGEAREDPAFEQLLQLVPMQPGTPLNHAVYEDFKTRLQTLGNNRGYFEAVLAEHKVTVDPEALRASVSLRYDSGPRYTFGAINFEDFPLDESRLLQLTEFKPGDAFDVALLQNLQSELQRTGYFGSTLVQPLSPDPESDAVPVQVQLQEGDRNHYRVGLGYSTDTRQRVSLTWRTPLLNERGHWQETRLESSPVRPRVNFTYGIPLGHPLDDQLRLGLRYENNEYGSLDSWQYEPSVRRDWTLGEWVASARLRYLYEDWELGRDKLNNHYLLPGFSLSHRASLGDRLDPEVGLSQLYLVEGGADQAASDIDLLRVYTQLRGVLTVAPNHRLVGRLELGAVNFSENDRPDLAPSLSFFAGGTYSIRGFGYQSLGPTESILLPDGSEREVVTGGDRLAIASAEYQYYVTPQWRAAVFVDAGNAYNAGDFEPVTGAGLGVHFVSPVGAIRIDLATPVSEDSTTWRVHLALGAEF